MGEKLDELTEFEWGRQKRVHRTDRHAAFEKWARLPLVNLNLQTVAPLKNKVGGRPTYRDPVTEIACAAWHAGIASRHVDA